MNANLYALLGSRFPADPAAVFIETPDGRHLTYQDADRESARLSALLARRGVGKGDRVVVQVKKSPEALLLYLACLRRGAVYVPLNPAYTAEETAWFIADAEPRLFVDNAEALTEEARGLAPSSIPAEAGCGDVAAILYTSGTTGRPKGAMITHGNLASNGLALHRIWGWRDGDVLLHALPIDHVHGLFVAVHCAMLNGSPMLFLPRFDAGQVVDLLPRATVMMGVPTHYTRLLGHPGFDAGRCHGMRLFVSGSAPLRSETFTAFEARSGHRILERYGMTECGMIASNPCDGNRIPGTVGFALPEVELRVDPGAGGLEVRGPNVFRGYWGLPDRTDEVFKSGGWFGTGDLAEIDETGRVTLSGRAMDLIISGGLNVYPKEVEDVLDGLGGVEESAVIGVPHPDLGEAVVAVVVGKDMEEDRILEDARAKLAGFKRPKRIFRVEALPRNAMGKVEKTRLRDSYGGVFET